VIPSKSAKYLSFFFFLRAAPSLDLWTRTRTYVRWFCLKLSRKPISSLVSRFSTPSPFSRAEYWSFCRGKATFRSLLLSLKFYLYYLYICIYIYILYIYIYIYYNNITYIILFAYNKISVFNGRRSPDGLPKELEKRGTAVPILENSYSVRYKLASTVARRRSGSRELAKDGSSRRDPPGGRNTLTRGLPESHCTLHLLAARRSSAGRAVGAARGRPSGTARKHAVDEETSTGSLPVGALYTLSRAITSARSAGDESGRTWILIKY